MKLNFDKDQCFSLPDKFYELINTEINSIRPTKSLPHSEPEAIVLNFRDPEYSAKDGGYHGVEIRLCKYNNHYQLIYITDFAFHGCPHAELVKEIDVCFHDKQVYHLYGGWLSKKEGIELIELFIGNFIEYHAMGVYTVEITFE
ncbi:MAG: DUF2787 domain-containing protein [Colwellia sp.]